MTAIGELFEALAEKAGARRSLKARETLFRAGARVHSMYVVATGSLRLVRTSTSGNEVTLHRAGAGESLAEPSLFSERYHCDAVADVPTEVVEYPKAQIISGLSRHPERMMELTRHLAVQVQALRGRAEILSIHRATDRLRAYLRLLATSDGDVVRIRSSWKQVATELGMTHEALYRALRRLESDRQIEREGTQVRLLSDR